MPSMNSPNRRRLLGLACSLLGAAMHPPPAAAEDTVYINDSPLPAEQRARLEAAYRTRLRPGRYWYDARTGWWGVQGQPLVGVVMPGMALGGPLRADASVGPAVGSTQVFINGRELHPQEVAYLRLLGPVLPGRYWADAWGNVGFEGQGFAFVNLYALAQQRLGDRGPHRSGNAAFNSDGRCSYFHSRDASGNFIGASSGCG